MQAFEIGGAGLVGGGNPPLIISGPCVIESESHCLGLATALKEMVSSTGLPLVFKASFDKANRTSLKSYRGPGLQEGLRILAKVKEETGLPILSDVHLPSQVGPASEVLDILQIPAFLCRQTDLLVAAADTGLPINVKKGQFLSPGDTHNIVEKVRSTGNTRLLLTERGTFFGYRNLVVDFRSIPLMQETGCPVIFDATHSVQEPGGRGDASGGDRSFIPILARAGMASGADGLFLEVHEKPEQALSDGANALPLSQLPRLLEEIIGISAVVRAKR